MKNLILLFACLIVVISWPMKNEKAAHIRTIQCKIERVGSTQYKVICPKVKGRSIASVIGGIYEYHY